jgi:hypothetical protein
MYIQPFKPSPKPQELKNQRNIEGRGTRSEKEKPNPTVTTQIQISEECFISKDQPGIVLIEER